MFRGRKLERCHALANPEIPPPMSIQHLQKEIPRIAIDLTDEVMTAVDRSYVRSISTLHMHFVGHRLYLKFLGDFHQHNMTSVATSLWDSIFTPGPTPILVKAMNISFFALFVLLIPLTYVTKNKHVFFLTILAIGLWIAMQWYRLPRLHNLTSRFLAELENAKKEQTQNIQEKKEE